MLLWRRVFSRLVQTLVVVFAAGLVTPAAAQGPAAEMTAISVHEGTLPIVVDGGFRRGTDVFKALALGATAVGIGRPYIWGLSAYGQQGVERVLDILNNELRLAMVGCGARTVKEITADSIVDTRRL